ncbi:MAG: DUF1152 domain-containing protein [Gemmataceae bacterium]
MLQLPIWTELESSKRVLVAGAGGGYDVFCGLPLYFALRQAGKEVWLANLSFSDIGSASGKRPTQALRVVTSDSLGAHSYFPECYLSQWFCERGEEVPVYCFAREGVKPLLQSYQHIAQTHQLDTVVLVDGGTDSLMRGDEAGLGTPHEDIVSIAAVDELEVANKYLVCLGFGIDAFHGVSHYDYLEGVADLIQTGGYLGTFSLLQEMPEAQRYREACEYVFECMSHRVSIVSSSILSALEGRFGNYHATRRTRGTELFINPLMSLYWTFRLDHVANRIKYLDPVKQTWTFTEVDDVIAHYRMHCQPRSRKQIPL